MVIITIISTTLIHYVYYCYVLDVEHLLAGHGVPLRPDPRRRGELRQQRQRLGAAPQMFGCGLMGSTLMGSLQKYYFLTDLKKYYMCTSKGIRRQDTGVETVGAPYERAYALSSYALTCVALSSRAGPPRRAGTSRGPAASPRPRRRGARPRACRGRGL